MAFRRIIFVVITFILFVKALSSQTLDGELAPCVSACETYQILGADISQTYYWTVNGGAVFPSIGTSTTICWNDLSGSIAVSNLGYNSPSNVIDEALTPTAIPSPDIVEFDNHICPVDSVDNNQTEMPAILCEKVCEGTTMVFEGLTNAGNALNWEIGGGVINSSSGNDVEVTWGNPGFAFLGLTESTNTCEEQDEICFEVIEKPNVTIETSPTAVASVVEICRGQTVYFNSDGTGALEYLWSLDGLTLSTAFAFDHTFESAGNFTMTLLSKSSCNCLSETSVNIVVNSDPGPPIRCVGAVCPGETVTYYTDDVCSDYNWTVSADGVVVDGGGTSDDFIEIQWTGGPIGTIELEVSNCNPTYCPRPSIVEIPIINSNVNIEGPAIVCNDAVDLYVLPEFTGTTYHWELIGSGYIQSGQGTNQIEVKWQNSWNFEPDATLNVTYENCFQGCSGSATKAITIKERFDIFASLEFCEGSNPYVNAAKLPGGWDPVVVDWLVEYPNGMTYSESSSSNLNFDFDQGPGYYELTATAVNSTDYCNTESKKRLHVVEGPSPLTEIIGESRICPGEIYTYQANGNILGEVEWVFEENGTSVVRQGNPVSHSWAASGPYLVSVSQSSITPPFCNSESIELTVEEVSTMSLSGPSLSCVDEVTIFDLNILESFNVDWSVVPASAGSLVLANSNASQMVNWHEPGIHEVRAVHCGQVASVMIEITPIVSPTITGPSGVCIGSSATIGTATAYSSYSWTDETGLLVSSSPTPSLAAGIFNLEVTTVSGCTLRAAHTIEEFESPVVSLTSSDNLWYCPPEAGVNLIVSANDIATYEWFEGGVSIGNNSSTNLLTEGTYHVEVTDLNGCKALSNEVSIVINCDPHGGKCTGGGTPYCAEELDAAYSFDFGADCTEIIFTNETLNSAGIFSQWNIADVVNGEVDYFTQNASHQFSAVGYYPVYLFEAVYNDLGQICIAEWREVIEIPVVANFQSFGHCVGAAIQFEDISAVLDGVTISSYEWNFDDASSISNTDTQSDPTHVFDAPGIYQVSLTVSDGSCTQSVTKDIEILAPTPIDFTYDDPSCELASTAFEATSAVNILNYSWDFGEPSSGAANSSTVASALHAYSTPGVYTVALEVLDVYGCTNIIQQTITIEPNTGSPNLVLSASSPICQGESIEITAPAGGQSYLWSTGETTPSILATTTGNYSLNYFDADGCFHELGPELIEVNPSPFAYGWISEYDEIGIPVGTHGTDITICEGQSISMSLGYVPGTTTTWSDGSSFSSLWNPTLTVGMNTFSAYLTDNNNSCESELVEFNVELIALPTQPLIDAAAQLCAEEENILSVNSPDPLLTYIWNTGEVGHSIIAFHSGSYYVEAFNDHGCGRKSPSVSVSPIPSVLAVPVGCLDSCLPESLCLPEVNGMSYQWFFNGDAIAAPEGQVEDFVITAEGNYYVEMTNANGCAAISDPLEVSNASSGSEIVVHLFDDADANTIFDVGETELENIPILIEFSDGTTFTEWSDQDGLCRFENLIAGDYTISTDQSAWNPCFPDPQMNNLFVTLECGDNEYLEMPFTANENSTTPLSLELPDYLWECGMSSLSIEPIVNYAGSLPITYLWSTGESSPSIDIMQSGMYTVTVSNDCESLTEEIEVMNENDAAGFIPMQIPTAFSPNGDNMNDAFKPIPSGGVEILSLDFRVYDRWGNLKFSTTSSAKGWEALENEVGVFVWVAKGNMNNCGLNMDFEKKGNVTVIK